MQRLLDHQNRLNEGTCKALTDENARTPRDFNLPAVTLYDSFFALSSNNANPRYNGTIRPKEINCAGNDYLKLVIAMLQIDTFTCSNYENTYSIQKALGWKKKLAPKGGRSL